MSSPERNLKTSGGRRLAKFAVLTLLVATAVVGATVGVLFWQGGLSTSGDEVDWTAVSAISAASSAIATVVLIAALGFTAVEFDRRAQELKRQADKDREHADERARQMAGDAKQERIARRPYIRADIAFADRHEANFAPPATTHVYSLAELSLHAAGHELSEIDSGSSYDSFDLVLWLTNLQLEPLGIADDVVVELSIWWRTSDALEIQVKRLSVLLAYLGPGQTTAIRLCRPPKLLNQVVAEVKSVSYMDIFGETSYESHGAMGMLYDDGEVRNERTLRRFETPTKIAP